MLDAYTSTNGEREGKNFLILPMASRNAENYCEILFVTLFSIIICTVSHHAFQYICEKCSLRASQLTVWHLLDSDIIQFSWSPETISQYRNKVSLRLSVPFLYLCWNLFAKRVFILSVQIFFGQEFALEWKIFIYACALHTYAIYFSNIRILKRQMDQD